MPSIRYKVTLTGELKYYLENSSKLVSCHS